MRLMIVVLLLLLVLGCSSPGGTMPSDGSVQPSADGSVQPADPFVRTVVDAADRVPNVQYRYSLLPNLNTHVVTVLGAKFRAALDHGIAVKPYSVVYVDRDKKEAFGVCEYLNYEACKPLGKVTALDIVDVDLVTPFDWVVTVPVDARIIGTESIDRQDAHIVEFGDADRLVRMWVHDFYLLPMKVQVLRDDEVLETHVYTLLQVGNVKEKDVAPPIRS